MLCEAGDSVIKGQDLALLYVNDLNVKLNEETKNEVLDIIKKHSEIIKINHFNSTPVGYKYQISFTIFVDGNLKTYESHEIANNLEKEILKKIDEIYLVVIHVNPIEVKNDKGRNFKNV